MKPQTLSFSKTWKPRLRYGIALKSRELQLAGSKSFEMKPVEVIGKGLTLGDSSGKARTIFMDEASPAHAVDCILQAAFIGKDVKGNPTFAKATNPAATAVFVLVKTSAQHKGPFVDKDGNLHTYGGAVRKLQGKPWFVATGYTACTDYVGRKPVEGRNYEALVALQIGDAVEIYPEGSNKTLVMANTKECGLQLFTLAQWGEWNTPKSAPTPVAAPMAAEDAAQSA